MSCIFAWKYVKGGHERRFDIGHQARHLGAHPGRFCVLGGVDVGVRHHDEAVAVAVFVGGVVDRLDGSGGLAAHCDAGNVGMVVALDVGDMVAPAVGVGDDSSDSPAGVESLDRGWRTGVGGGRVGFLRVRDCVGLAGVARGGDVAVAGRRGGAVRNGAGTRVVRPVVADGLRGAEGDGGGGGRAGGGVKKGWPTGRPRAGLGWRGCGG